jgi:hypothetical protein
MRPLVFKITGKPASAVPVLLALWSRLDQYCAFIHATTSIIVGFSVLP